MTEPIVDDEFDREGDDFLAFWDERQAEEEVPTKRIFGVDVPIPHDIPIGFEVMFQKLQGSQKIEDFLRLLGMLFSRDVVNLWVDRGVSLKQTQVLVAWGMSNGSGNAIEFAEAAEIVKKAEQMQADGEGKAPAALNRAARRASSRTAESASTGR